VNVLPLRVMPPPGPPPVPAPAPATKPSTGTVVAGVAAAGGLVALLIFLIKGAMVVSSVHDTVKIAHGAIKRVRGQPKENPIAPRALEGRRVAYRAFLDPNDYAWRDRILFERDGRATLYRGGERVVTFDPSSHQRTKIRSGYGEVLVFLDQITEGARS
jgi:hypothetical protein